ncbi:MAG: hypothetical protein WBQ08_16525 [Candidatus Sulfotelmatobacter sp.]
MNGFANSIRELGRIRNDLGKQLEDVIDVLFDNEIPMSPSEPKGALKSKLSQRIAILKLGKRNSVAQLSMPIAEIDVNRKVFSCVVATVKPKLIRLHKSKFLKGGSYPPSPFR